MDRADSLADKLLSKIRQQEKSFSVLIIKQADDLADMSEVVANMESDVSFMLQFRKNPSTKDCLTIYDIDATSRSCEEISTNLCQMVKSIRSNLPRWVITCMATAIQL